VIVPIRAFIHATELCPRRGSGQDRISVAATRDRIVIALADGAGGTAGGERAAEAVIEAVAAAQGDDWAAVLTELELDPDRLGPGQTTAVVVTVTLEGIHGASAGDSGALVIRHGQIEDLTRGQQRKPLIGDHSVARPFAAGPLGGGTLLVASDGLLRHARPDEIVRIASGPDLVAAARELVGLVRLPSGEVPDDVAIVLCREVDRPDR
jgi:serine/threonine protein phosphatase PrpC